MRGRFAPYIIGTGLLSIAAVLAVFAIWAAAVGEPWLGFAIAVGAAALVGAPMLRVGSPAFDPSRREALMGVLLLWFAIPFFSAIPFVVSGGMSPLNGMFEAMSGFTTTGATVLRDFSTFSNSLFMWRALTQWIGGVGIIVLFIAVFPQLAIAGRQLFFAEAPGPTEERLTPRLRNTASAVLIVYVGLTLACGLAYLVAGMSPFDALAHAFTTLAAGGFSPKPFSYEDFANPAIDWIATVFMVFAGMNFALQFRAFTGRPTALFRDAEFRAYIVLIVVVGAVLSLYLVPLYGVADALRHGFFQTLAILTTTGYASVDFAAWNLEAQGILVALMFIGGSAGSAAGGIKVVRWLIVAQNTAAEVRRSLHPRAILPVRVGRRIVPDEVLRAVAAFITLYVGLFATTTLALVFLGSDFVTAFTASIACIGNIGPGLGGVGPMANYADLHPVARALLIFGMYAGRLEIVTVFVVFTPGWWTLPRRNVFRPWG